jgi:hypothetical protein
MAKWVYRPSHEKANERGFVAYEDLGWESDKKAIHAPIATGRFYENTKSIIDGSDIGSRKRYNEHNKRHKVTHSSDISPQFLEGVVKEREREDDRDRVETLKRATYEVFNRRR